MKLLLTYCILFFTSIIMFAQSNQWSYYPVQSKFKCQALEGQYLWIGTEKYLSRLNTVTEEREIFPLKGVITSIAIDRLGNKWIGSWEDGLKKFDGETWTYYDSLPIGVTIRGVSSLNSDQSGNLWIGAYSRLIKYDGENWTLFNVSDHGFPNGIIAAVLTDSKGNIWVGVDSNGPYHGGMLKFDGQNWTTFNPSNWDAPFGGVKSIGIDSLGILWLGTETGLVKYDGVKWATFNTSNSPLPQDNVNSVVVDIHGNKWIATGGGLTKFDDHIWTVYNKFGSDSIYFGILSILIDKQGNKWIGTDVWDPEGITLAKYDDQRWTKYNTSNTDLVMDDFSSLIILDQDDNLWYGGSSKIWKYDKQSCTTYNLYKAGSAYNVTSMVNDQMGNIWIGTRGPIENENPGLLKFDGQNWTVFNKSNSGLPHNNIGSVAVDANGALWMTTDQGNLIKYDGLNWISYSLNDDDSVNNYIQKILIDLEGNIWAVIIDYDLFATKIDLAKFDGQIWTIYNYTNSGIPNDFISSFAIDHQNNIWLGMGESGLVKFNGEEWIIYNTSNSDIPYNHVDFVTTGHGEDIWIGSVLWGNGDGGLIKFDGQNWNLYTTSNSGLPYNNNVNSIAVDRTGNLWIAVGYYGLVYVPKDGIVDVKNEKMDLPLSFSLDQNYPNPFNPTTIIQYTIPQSQHVELTIYNILGQKVSILVNNFKEAGSYSVQFNAENLSSGIYFYKIKAGDLVETKKMVLVR